ncbi:MAG: membrane integrity-associated transporter subunit PqiC [Gammaproteobacteria bacterium]|nr:membrane integrity-associated transporter subunit PqiC [Gammaproteobacteria bacterium]
MKTRVAFFVAVVALLTACSSGKPNINYYQLSPAPTTQQVDLNLPTLFFETISLVDYLKQTNLILANDSGQLYVTRYHVWAEPLEQAIARSMVNHLNQSQQKFRAQHQFKSSCGGQCYRVKLLVEQFYPTESNQVIFAGKYQLIKDGKVIAQQDFNLQQTLKQDGYGAAVSSLHQLTIQLASQIAQRLATVE